MRISGEKKSPPLIFFNYNGNMKNILICMTLVILVSACAGGPGVPGSPPSAAGDKDRLDTRDFAGLPPEAKAYLQILSRAFRNQDKNFLLSQGESQFEAEVKPHYDDGSYLALLYRSGQYAAESPRTGTQSPRLNPADIHHIEYTRWEENGPMLEIEGSFLTMTGGVIPCKIILIWRLKEPKILGRFP
jgi:hypothetical protein